MSDTPDDDAVSHFSGYAEHFHGHYQDRAEFRERLEIWHELLDRYAVPDGRSVDLGCGTGVFTLYLAAKGGDVTGVDGAPNMIRLCEQQKAERGLQNVRFMQARLPAVDEPALRNADLVISSSVIEYVPDLEATLALFGRLVKPGGTLIVSMPNRQSLSRMYERLKFKLTGQPHIYRHIIHFTTPRALARRLASAGLRLEEVRYYTHFTRVARLTRALGCPPVLTEDLFVAVFRKS